MYNKIIKPFLDITIAIIAILALIPVWFPVLIIMTISNKGSAFYFQKRPGFNSKVFKIVKFKTMNDKKDSDGVLLPNDVRITSLGKLIRKLSIDEIPQLFNVLKGEMSIVGPRPLKVEYLAIYNDVQIKRHNVKPGITGYAQVKGRNAISHTKKFELDVWYVENLSFALDVKIVYWTFLKLVNRKEVSGAMINMNEPFNGSN